MHPNIEAFYRPTTLEEAHRLLTNPDQKAIPIAGATEVSLRIRSTVKALVDLSALGLDTIWEDHRGLHLGAMVRATQLVDDARVRAFCGASLPESAFAIASEPIRNLTSIGGNVVHLTSWSDTPPALLALGAHFRVQGADDRWYTADEFFAQLPKKLLADGDLVTEVVVPPQPAHTGSCFLKHAKTAVDFALVNAAATVTRDGDTISEVKIAIGAIHTPPIRVTDAEDMLRGQVPTDALLAKAADAVAAQVNPRKDARASQDYLRHCAGVVARRAVRSAFERGEI